MAASLRERHGEALLVRDLAELRTDLPLRPGLDELRWRGARRPRLEALCRVLEDDAVLSRITRWAS